MNTPGSYDDTPQAWLLRDAAVSQMAERIRTASTFDREAEQASCGLAYIALAAKAEQHDRMRAWVLELGAAQAEAMVRLGGA